MAAASWHSQWRVTEQSFSAFCGRVTELYPHCIASEGTTRRSAKHLDPTTTTGQKQPPHPVEGKLQAYTRIFQIASDTRRHQGQRGVDFVQAQLAHTMEQVFMPLLVDPIVNDVNRAVQEALQRAGRSDVGVTMPRSMAWSVKDCHEVDEDTAFNIVRCLAVLARRVAVSEKYFRLVFFFVDTNNNRCCEQLVRRAIIDRLVFSDNAVTRFIPSAVCRALIAATKVTQQSGSLTNCTLLGGAHHDYNGFFADASEALGFCAKLFASYPCAKDSSSPSPTSDIRQWALAALKRGNERNEEEEHPLHWNLHGCSGFTKPQEFSLIRSLVLQQDVGHTMLEVIVKERIQQVATATAAFLTQPERNHLGDLDDHVAFITQVHEVLVMWEGEVRAIFGPLQHGTAAQPGGGSSSSLAELGGHLYHTASTLLLNGMSSQLEQCAVTLGKSCLVATALASCCQQLQSVSGIIRNEEPTVFWRALGALLQCCSGVNGAFDAVVKGLFRAMVVFLGAAPRADIQEPSAALRPVLVALRFPLELIRSYIPSAATQIHTEAAALETNKLMDSLRRIVADHVADMVEFPRLAAVCLMQTLAQDSKNVAPIRSLSIAEVVSVVEVCKEKDVFMQHVAHLLAHRLLLMPPPTSSDDGGGLEDEREVVMHLKQELGAACAAPVTNLFEDALLARRSAFTAQCSLLMEACRDAFGTPRGQPSLCEEGDDAVDMVSLLSPNIAAAPLTVSCTLSVSCHSLWKAHIPPMFLVSGSTDETQQHVCTAFNSLFGDLSTQLAQMYLQRSPKRRLSWSTASGSVAIKWTPLGASTSVELSILPFAVCVLYAWQTPAKAPEDEYKTTKVVSDLTGMPMPAVVAAVGALRAAGVLEQHPDDKVSYRPGAKLRSGARKLRVKVPVPTTIVANHEQQRALAADRLIKIEAVVVRVLKSRQSLPHTALQVEVSRLLAGHFTVTIGMLKQAIERLMEREFVYRDANDTNLYHYQTG